MIGGAWMQCGCKEVVQVDEMQGGGLRGAGSLWIMGLSGGFGMTKKTNQSSFLPRMMKASVGWRADGRRQ